MWKSKPEGRMRYVEGQKCHNWSVVIFEEDLNTQFKDVLDKWYEKGVCAGYVIAPLHDKDKYSQTEKKPAHQHINVYFTDALDEMDTEDIFKPFYTEEGWCRQISKTWDHPYWSYEARKLINYYIHIYEPQKFCYDKNDLIIKGDLWEDAEDGKGHPISVDGKLVDGFDPILDQQHKRFCITFREDARDENSLLYFIKKYAEVFRWNVYLEERPCLPEGSQNYHIIIEAPERTTKRLIEMAFHMRNYKQTKRSEGKDIVLLNYRMQFEENSTISDISPCDDIEKLGEKLNCTFCEATKEKLQEERVKVYEMQRERDYFFVMPELEIVKNDAPATEEIEFDELEM